MNGIPILLIPSDMEEAGVVGGAGGVVDSCLQKMSMKKTKMKKYF